MKLNTNPERVAQIDRVLNNEEEYSIIKKKDDLAKEKKNKKKIMCITNFYIQKRNKELVQLQEEVRLKVGSKRSRDKLFPTTDELKQIEQSLSIIDFEDVEVTPETLDDVMIFKTKNSLSHLEQKQNDHQMEQEVDDENQFDPCWYSLGESDVNGVGGEGAVSVGEIDNVGVDSCANIFDVGRKDVVPDVNVCNRICDVTDCGSGKGGNGMGCGGSDGNFYKSRLSLSTILHLENEENENSNNYNEHEENCAMEIENFEISSNSENEREEKRKRTKARKETKPKQTKKRGGNAKNIRKVEVKTRKCEKEKRLSNN